MHATRSDDRAAEQQATLASLMRQHFIDAVFAGRDETLPSVSLQTPRREGDSVSQWLTNCDDTQQRLIFKLVHQALNKDNLQGLHDVAAELVEYVANDFAELYVESRA